MVTVIYKSPQDRAPSDPAFLTLSFIDTASARQACLLFPELSCPGAFAVRPLPHLGLECSLLQLFALLPSSLSPGLW